MGDSGKSTVLEAIDLCLGARRIAQFTDSDFHYLNVDSPIRLILTIGELGTSLKNIDTCGPLLRGFNAITGEIEDEPEQGLETVLSLSLAARGETQTGDRIAA